MRLLVKIKAACGSMCLACLWCLSALLLSACGQTGEDASMEGQDSLADTVGVAQLPPAVELPDSLSLTPAQRDSLEFRLVHHYGEGFNFRVTADSLMLVPRVLDGQVSDTCMVYRQDLLVVADVRRLVSQDSLGRDTFWIKVAHDQFTMGWVEEEELLRAVVPDDSISRMLHGLTSSRGVWMSLPVLLGLLVFVCYRRGRLSGKWTALLRESDSWYAPLLIVLVALLAVTYATVQLCVPEFWLEYYFHPTLNPLLLPGVMCWMVVLVWLIVIAFIALVIEVYHSFYFLRGAVFLLEVLGLAMATYLIVSWVTRCVGYVIALFLPAESPECLSQCGGAGVPFDALSAVCSLVLAPGVCG